MSRPHLSTPRFTRRNLMLSAVAAPVLAGGLAPTRSGAAAGVTACPPAAVQLDPIRPKVNNYEAWPHLLATPGGAILCGYTARDQHLAVKGSASVIVRSADGGRTWSTIRVRQKSDRGWSFEAMAVLADGRIMTLHSRNTSNVHDDPDRIIAEISQDDGRTFQEISAVDTGGSLVTLGDLTDIGDGILLAPYHGDGWGVLRSEDSGESWTVTGTSNGGKWPYEGRIVADGGELVMIARNPEIGLLVTRSADQGKTWTQAVSTGLGVKYEGMHADGSTIHLVLADRTSGEITATTSTVQRLIADPEDWEQPCRIANLDATGAAAEQGYPDLAPIDGGGMLMAAYDGENPDTDIRLWRIA